MLLVGSDAGVASPASDLAAGRLKMASPWLKRDSMKMPKENCKKG